MVPQEQKTKRKCPECSSERLSYLLHKGIWFCVECKHEWKDDISVVCDDCGAKYSTTGMMEYCLNCLGTSLSWIGNPRIGYELEVPRTVRQEEKVQELTPELIGKLLASGNRKKLLELGLTTEQIDNFYKMLNSLKV